MTRQYNRGGRPTKLTPEVADVVVEGISLGLSYRKAAEAAGISERTLHTWRKRGSESKRKNRFSQFHQRIEEAEAKTAIKMGQAIVRSVLEPSIEVKKHTKKLPGGGELVEVYETHRPPNAKYAAWWLERRMPEQFGRRVEKTGHMKVDTGEQRIVYEFVAPDGTVETLVVDPEDEGGGDGYLGGKEPI